jgi:hypothetical protein
MIKLRERVLWIHSAIAIGQFVGVRWLNGRRTRDPEDTLRPSVQPLDADMGRFISGTGTCCAAPADPVLSDATGR